MLSRFDVSLISGFECVSVGLGLWLVRFVCLRGVIVCLFGLDVLFGLGLVTCGVLVWS